MSSEQAEDQTVYLCEIFQDLVDELDGRLEQNLSENDRLAVGAAIGKAAWRGLMRGIASHSYATERVTADLREWLRGGLRPGVEVPERLLRTFVRGDDGDLPQEPDIWEDARLETSDERDV